MGITITIVSFIILLGLILGLAFQLLRTQEKLGKLFNALKDLKEDFDSRLDDVAIDKNGFAHLENQVGFIRRQVSELEEKTVAGVLGKIAKIIGDREEVLTRQLETLRHLQDRLIELASQFGLSVGQFESAVRNAFDGRFSESVGQLRKEIDASARNADSAVKEEGS